MEMSGDKGPQERDFTPRHIGALYAIEDGAEINWLNENEQRPPPKHTYGYVEGLWQAGIIVLKFKVKGPSISLKEHFVDTPPHPYSCSARGNYSGGGTLGLRNERTVHSRVC